MILLALAFALAVTSVNAVDRTDPSDLIETPAPSPLDADEHRLLADSAMVQMLRLFSMGAIETPFGFELDQTAPVLNGSTFGDLVVRFAANDDRPDRYQVAQASTLEQVSDLTSADLDRIWEQRTASSPGEGLPLAGSSENALGMYLIHHVMALRSAQAAAAEGADGETAFRAMLAYEAAAQGFLHDALSSSHMLVPKHDFMPWLHGANSRAAHGYYAVEGVYVINSLGTAYEAFGDGVLPYFSSAFNAAQEASLGSLLSVLYVYMVRSGQSVPPEVESEIQKQIGGGSITGLVDAWLESRDGAGYYGEARLPGLLHIPTPVAATWSTRNPETGQRTHELQLAEEGYHDPDLLEVLAERLPSADQVPEAFRPDNLGSDQDARMAIDTVKNLASVEFIQDFRLKPSYDGWVFELGSGVAYAYEEWKPAISASIGMGSNDFVFVEDLAVLGGATFIIDRPDVYRLTGATNLGDSPPRLELGVATTSAGVWDTMGLAIGGAVDLVEFDYGFTYAGGILRLRYDGKIFREMVHAFTLQLAIH